MAGPTQRLIIKVDMALKLPPNLSISKPGLFSFLFPRSTTISTSPVSVNDTIERVDLYLLRCASLLACEQPALGLKDADEALSIAEDEREYIICGPKVICTEGFAYGSWHASWWPILSSQMRPISGHGQIE